MAANVIRQEVLLEALKISKNSQTPVGRVLMTIGELSESDVETAIYIQGLIRNSVISSDFGVKVINVSVKGRIPLEEAFRRLGWTPPADVEQQSGTLGELGELLVQAGLIDRSVLEQALYQSHENNLPLGRCLVLNRAISSNLLQSALTAQVLMRDGKITEDQAINSLKNSARKQQSLEQSLVDAGAYRQPAKESVKLGDLLSQAGLVTEGDKISAIEIGLNENQKIGEVLIQTGMIAPGVVDESLRLQEMVSSGELSGLQAADILRQANARKVGIDVIMEERASRKEEVEKINAVLEVILQSGALSGENFNRAQSLARQLNVSIAEVILTKEMVEKRLIMAAYQGQSLVNDGIINGAQCVLAMKMCVKTGKEFHEVLKELPSDTAESSPPVDDAAGGDKKSGWLGNLWSKVTKKD
ncbi:MAG: hypothetical protein SFV17_27505 [Candidatus Obscuribacter sp.]|nr:hypothetical protein [Candidatus Obscuribacter sp.]